MLAIIGKSWGTGVCIPRAPWPPAHPPTVPYVEPKPVDMNELKLQKVSGRLTQEQQAQANDLVMKHTELWPAGKTTGTSCPM